MLAPQRPRPFVALVAIQAFAGLALAGVASIAHAQTWLPPPLCTASQAGMPCNSNAYDLCLPTLCWQIEDRLNDAGEDVGVPVSCTECTACVQSDCRAVGCPYGGVCTYRGTPQTPCGGFGYGPPSNPDQTTFSTPDYFCDMEGGAVTGPPPSCPNLSGWTDLCGPQPGGGGSSGEFADAGSSSTDGGTVAPVSGSSSGSGSSVPTGGVGGGSSGSTGSGAALSPRAASLDAAPASSQNEALVRGACAIGPGSRPTGAEAAWQAALALGLLLMLRKGTPSR